MDSLRNFLLSKLIEVRVESALAKVFQALELSKGALFYTTSRIATHQIIKDLSEENDLNIIINKEGGLDEESFGNVVAKDLEKKLNQIIDKLKEFHAHENVETYEHHFVDIFTTKIKMKRFLTLKEFEEEYGENWQNILDFTDDMKYMAGQVLDPYCVRSLMRGNDKLPIRLLTGESIQKDANPENNISGCPIFVITCYMLKDVEEEATLFDYKLAEDVRYKSTKIEY